MKKYRCIKAFSVERCDGNGFPIENEYIDVNLGDVYELDESGVTIMSADTHLDKDDGTWLELSYETLEEHFEEVEQ